MFKSPNVGSIDRIIRSVAGLVLLSLAVFQWSGAAQLVAAIVGVVLILTALVRFCPAYRLFGIRTDAADQG